MALTDLPKITPSKGTVFFMAAFLATFSYFFTRTSTSTEKPISKITNKIS